MIYGRELACISNIQETLNTASKSTFEFVAIPLFHPRLQRDALASHTRLGPATRSDAVLDCSTWVANIVGTLSTWIDVDSDIKCQRDSCELALCQELDWAVHLGLQAVIVPMVSRDSSPNLSKIILRYCHQLENSYQQLWIRLPLSLPTNRRSVDRVDGWHAWDNFFRNLGYHHKVFVALELDDDVPEDFENTFVRWRAEPVKAIIIPSRVFITNKNGYPVLSSHHQNIISLFLDSRMHVIFTGKPRSGHSFSAFIQYMKYLQALAKPSISEAEKFTHAYKDTLQSPLQPLMDNLESQTYETFEKDVTKYIQYENAISKAFLSCAERNRIEENQVQKFSVIVVGAGRGPLVNCTLLAASKLSISVHIFAVEKNANAVITLKNRVMTERWTNVTVIPLDARAWKSPVCVDLIVSELLGVLG